ncbi:MAG: HNH endonuclease [Chromatiaceae bacterium]|jgi:RNA-directed DNA polymerase|nr:HNH endonuclease [Chromatiaceae bacterium]
MDHSIFRALWNWAKRRHPNKGQRWIRERYFRQGGTRSWVFACGDAVLMRLSDLRIQRHVKIAANANPHEPEWETYFEDRLKVSMSATQMGKRKLQWLWNRQEGHCPQCGQAISKATGWHVHHVVPKALGGSDKPHNLSLLHPNCHRQLHCLERKATVP